MGFTTRRRSGKILNGSTMIVPGEGISSSKVEIQKSYPNKNFGSLNSLDTESNTPSPTPTPT